MACLDLPRGRAARPLSVSAASPTFSMTLRAAVTVSRSPAISSCSDRAARPDLATTQQGARAAATMASIPAGIRTAVLVACTRAGAGCGWGVRTAGAACGGAASSPGAARGRSNE